MDKILSYLKMHQLTAEECEEIMHALRSQNEVLSGGVVTRHRLGYIADVLCAEHGVSDEKAVGKVKKRTEELFIERRYFGEEGSCDMLIEKAADEAISEMQSEK